MRAGAGGAGLRRALRGCPDGGQRRHCAGARGCAVDTNRNSRDRRPAPRCCGNFRRHRATGRDTREHPRSGPRCRGDRDRGRPECRFEWVQHWSAGASSRPSADLRGPQRGCASAIRPDADRAGGQQARSVVASGNVGRVGAGAECRCWPAGGTAPRGAESGGDGGARRTRSGQRFRSDCAGTVDRGAGQNASDAARGGQPHSPPSRLGPTRPHHRPTDSVAARRRPPLASRCGVG